VRLTLTFMTPMLPDDLDVLTRPLTYVTWQAVSTDGKPHQVAAMLALGGDLAVNTADQPVVARRETFGDLNTLVIGSEAQPVLRSKGDDHRIDWGFLYVTAARPLERGDRKRGEPRQSLRRRGKTAGAG
jgi:hypothetical protein